MSLGVMEAARRLQRRVAIRLAVDNDSEALSIYKRNFPKAVTKSADICGLFGARTGIPPTEAERRILARIGRVDVLLGGPPCQGHSDLNNHTRRDDPKNGLLLRMARAAEVLRPSIVIIENVPAVHLDKNRSLQTTLRALSRTGYAVAGSIVDLFRVGVPQRRRRFLVIASRVPEIRPAMILGKLNVKPIKHARTVRWAIADLLGIDREGIFDTAATATVENRNRIRYLFHAGKYDLPNSRRPSCHRDKKHSYSSVYGRLSWGRPAQTITTGFGSMGQGRYVHPARRRTITPHEAARLQTFPDWFKFDVTARRSVLSKVIGNAVPPFVMLELGQLIIPKL